MNPIQIKLPSKKPFPLWALLYLYENANSADVFPNYMEGMQLLIEWLGPIDTMVFFPSDASIPKLHRNYELNRIAEMLEVHPNLVYNEYGKVIKWIYDLNN